MPNIPANNLAADSASGREGEPTHEDILLAAQIDAFYHGHPVTESGNLRHWIARHRAAACREAVREATADLAEALKEAEFQLLHCRPNWRRNQSSGDIKAALAKIQYALSAHTLRAHAARLEEMKGRTE